MVLKTIELIVCKNSERNVDHEDIKSSPDGRVFAVSSSKDGTVMFSLLYNLVTRGKVEEFESLGEEI